MLHSAKLPGAAFCFCSVKLSKIINSISSTAEKSVFFVYAVQILNVLRVYQYYFLVVIPS